MMSHHSGCEAQPSPTMFAHQSSTVSNHRMLRPCSSLVDMITWWPRHQQPGLAPQDIHGITLMLRLHLLKQWEQLPDQDRRRASPPTTPHPRGKSFILLRAPAGVAYTPEDCLHQCRLCQQECCKFWPHEPDMECSCIPCLHHEQPQAGPLHRLGHKLGEKHIRAAARTSLYARHQHTATQSGLISEG